MKPDVLIPGGCVLVARKMLDSDIMNQSPLVLKLWLWFLMKANWKDRDQLKRGELVTTIAEMQEAMSHFAGWRKICPTRDQIRSAYESLACTTRITTRKTTRGMIISIINYDTYQNTLAYVSHTETRNENAAYPSATPHDTESLNQENQESKPSSCPKPKKPVSDEAIRLSNLLADMILKNNPRHTKLSNGGRESTVANWSLDVDMLIRIDGQEPQEVERVIAWCQSDSFWKANILSGSKLRKQWDALTAKMRPTASQPEPRKLQVAI